MSSSIRPAAVAGSFYPGVPQHLAQMVRGYLSEQTVSSIRRPKALVLPHAGYIYSGPVAATGYRLLQAFAADVSRVVLLGPAHTVPLSGLAAPSVKAFETPLGQVVLERSVLDDLAQTLSQVKINDLAHAAEHSLEVQLPFLQIVIPSFALVPLVIGQVSTVEVAEVLRSCWGGPETLILISSDLSHFHPYEEARKLDTATAVAIESFRDNSLVYDSACGRYGIGGLLREARTRQMTVERLDLRNSGDTAGDKRQVVGYGAWAFYES